MAGGDERLQRRESRASDAEWAKATHHRAVRAVVERQFGTWDEGQQDRFFAADWRSGAFEIVELNGEPCGYVCIEVRESEVHLRELVIAPEYQGRGLGTAIIKATIKDARRRHVPVVLETLRGNHARLLYRRLGFSEVGETDTHVLFRLNPVELP